MSDEPNVTEVEPNPAIVEVEHPEPHIVGEPVEPITNDGGAEPAVDDEAKGEVPLGVRLADAIEADTKAE